MIEPLSKLKDKINEQEEKVKNEKKEPVKKTKPKFKGIKVEKKKNKKRK